MKLLVIGRSGQVARALQEMPLASGASLTALGRPELDLLSPASIRTAIDRHAPDLVINTAAYTAVDNAETDAEAATLLNEAGPAALADATAFRNIPLIHISTDYVFDGALDRAYREDDPVAPLGVYGRTKLASERAVAAGNARHVILRTAWVYSPFGKNFVKTMLRLAVDRVEVSVVADQIGNPTSAHALAGAILQISGKLLGSEPHWGTYHAAGTGDAVWADLAEHVFSVSASLGGPTARVNRITSAEYPTPVARPANSRLDCTRLKQGFGCRLPLWQESATEVTTRLVREESYFS